MVKCKKNVKWFFCSILFIVSTVCFTVSGFAADFVGHADTVDYAAGTDGVYVTESFENAVSYKTKTDATVIPDSATTYGKTLSKMLSVKLSEGVDISAAGRSWDGFLIDVAFSSSFKFYLWLADVGTDGSVVISRNYNNQTNRYEKFIDRTGKDLSADGKGVITRSGYYMSSGAVSGTWVYNFSDIVVKPNQIIDELLFGLRMNENTYFGQGFEINSISVYKVDTESSTGYTVKTLFNAKDLTVTTDPTDTTAGINLADARKGSVVNTARTLANNTGSFIDESYDENETGNANVIVTVPTCTVTVNYLNEDEETIKDAESTVYRKGHTYSVDAPVISGYVFKESDVALSGTVNSDITVNLVYAVAGVSVTVRHVDEQGNTVSAQTSRSYYEGASYTVTPLSVLGYEYVSADKDLSGIINEDITVTLTYRQVETFVLTVKFADEQGNELIPDQTYTYNSGATYEVEPAEIEYYAYKQADKELVGTICEDTEIIMTYETDALNPPRLHTDVNYAVSDDGLRITDSLIGGVVFKTKDNFSVVADSTTTYGKTILATFKINFTETIDAVNEWDGLLIRIKNNSAKNVKFNAYLYSEGLLGRNYVSSTARDEVFVDASGTDIGKIQKGVKYASAYPTISAYADGTWNYKFSDLTTATAGSMTSVSAFILGLRVTSTEFAGCDIVIGSIAAYKADAQSDTGYIVKTLFNAKDLVVSNESDYGKADVNTANSDKGKVITSAVAPINNTGLFVEDKYYSELHPKILAAIKLELQGCTVVCNYIDENGDQLSVSDSVNVAKGGTYEVVPKVITGYDYKSADHALTGTAEDDLTVNLSYELKKFTLTVKFVDTEGKTVKDDTVITVRYGDYVVIDENNALFKVDGYRHKSVESSAKFTVYSSQVRTVVCEAQPEETEQKQESGCKGNVFGSVYGAVISCLIAVAAVSLKKFKKGVKR